MKRPWVVLFVLAIVCGTAYAGKWYDGRKVFEGGIISGVAEFELPLCGDGTYIGFDPDCDDTAEITMFSDGSMDMDGNLSVGGSAGQDSIVYAPAGEALYLSANGPGKDAVFSADNATVTFVSSSGAVNGKTLTIRTESPSPDDNDLPARFNLEGWNSAGEDVIYGQIYVKADDVTDGTEDGTLYYREMANGTLGAAVAFGAGSGAPVDATYLTATLNGTLTSEVYVPATDDSVMVGNGSNWQIKTIPDCDAADDTLNYDQDTNTWSCGSDASLGAETNSLETTITGIADTEIFVGNGADSGTFVVMSGDGTLTNAGVFALGNDVVDDNHINWGAGAGQVNSDDVPEGSTNYYDDDGVDDDDPEAGDVDWPDLTDNGTFTDTKLCTYDSGNTRIDCNTDPSAETNSLESTITGIEDTEIFIGTGSNTGNFVTISGAAALANNGALSLNTDVVNDTHIDWGSGGNQVDSDDVPEGSTNYYDDDGVDDDVPESGDFGAAGDLDADGTISSGTLINTKCVYIENPTADDDLKSIWTTNGFAATITKMWCESDQTVNMDLQVDDGSPADVNGSDLQCDSTPAEDESMGGDATMADGHRLDVAIESVSGDPTWVSFCWTYTID
jgi:hypothetical protein